MASAETFDVYIGEDGLHRLEFERLVKAGLEAPQIASAALSLSNGGQPVPMVLVPGDAEAFGPGTALIFEGRRPRRADGGFGQESPLSTYLLETDGSAPSTIERFAFLEPAAEAGDPSVLGFELKVEEDWSRFGQTKGTDSENDWFWSYLSTDGEPLRKRLDLPMPIGESGFRLCAELRARSKPRFKSPGVFDHALRFSFDDQELGIVEFDAVTGADYRACVDLPQSKLGGEGWLEIGVEARRDEELDVDLIDVIWLDRFEIEAKVAAYFDEGQAYRRSPAGELVIEVPADSSWRWLVDVDGRFIRLAADARRDGVRRYVVAREGLPEAELLVAADADLLQPRLVILDQPSDLHGITGADYVMVAHHRLLGPTERLAQMHRKRGLEVVVVDIEDIWDEFNHGELEAMALNEFFEMAWNTWSPRPRFALLVGDASWDYRGSLAAGTVHPGDVFEYLGGAKGDQNIDYVPYDDAGRYGRNLLPSLVVRYGYEFGASDSDFVDFDGDHVPEIAIGRLPMATEDELDHVVTKIIDYIEKPAVGPWKREMLFVASDNPRYQRANDLVADDLSESGYIPRRVYTSAEEASNHYRTADLVEQLDQGRLVVQFFGHGGRFIWRTGPSDLKENRDLFGLEHLQQLADNPRNPLVISLTCYSAPFDHPEADSLGEGFLRLAGRGAIAVVASTWRSTPSPEMGRRILVDSFATGTIGEGLRTTKATLKRPRQFLQLFVLLGDPAIGLTQPQEELELTRRGDIVVLGPELGSHQRSLISWLDAETYTIAEQELSIDGVQELEIPEGAARLVVYVWDEESKRDAFGVLELAPEDDAEAVDSSS